MPEFGLNTGLRESGRTVSQSRERHRARAVLVVVQVALALVLLIGSGLMIRTFQALRRVQPGFRQPAEVLTLSVSLPEAQVKDAERVVRMDRDIAARVAAIPGVESAALSSSIPMDGESSSDLLFAEDHPLAEGQLPPIRRFKFVSPGYFATIGNPIVAGRDLTWTDVLSYRPVVLVSENLAREYWRDPARAIGKRVRESSKDEWREIVGVAGNSYDDGVNQPAPASVYWPQMMKNFWGEENRVQRTMTFAIRSKRTGRPRSSVKCGRRFGR